MTTADMQTTNMPDEAARTASQRGENSHPGDGLDVLLLLASRRRLLGRVTLGSALLALAIVILLPNIYVANTKLMPPQQTPSVANLMQNQLGALASLSGTKDLGLRDPSDLYATMLQSRSVARALIARFKLQEVYGEERIHDAEEELRDATSVAVGREGVITVTVEDTDPKRAADLANGYVEELRRLSQALSEREAEERRAFFESQLQQARDELAKAEARLKATQEKTGLLELSNQSRLIIESVARLQAQVRAKEVQLKTMQTFASPQNPDVVRVTNELAELRAQLQRLERSKGEPGNIQIPTGKIPETGLAYLRDLREVNYYEIIFEVLAKQYEAAKIDEARVAANIQVLDLAAVPEKKTRPRRALLVLLAALLGMLCSIMYVLAQQKIAQLMHDPDSALRWQQLRRSFRDREPRMG